MPNLIQDDPITNHAEYFAVICQEYFDSLLKKKFNESQIRHSTNGVKSKKEIFASILFTGSIYGEYILALDRSLARKMVAWMKVDGNPETTSDQEIVEVLSEFLNIVVGQSVTSLTKNFEKLTITSPRVFFGSANYPSASTGSVVLSSDDGDVECLIYIDQMKLDIAESYKAALQSITKANSDLQVAMKKLQQQQELIVQMEKQSALGLMAAGVAHELNTPLTTIKLIGDRIKMLIDEKDVNRNTFLKSVDIIDNTVERISKITTNLRIFAKGLQSETYRDVNVKTLIDDSLELLQEDLKNKKIKLQMLGSRTDLKLSCRPTEIGTVIYGLVVNSAESILGLEEKWIQIDYSETDTHIVFSFVDSGNGIEKDIASKMFDPFFTTKEFSQGPGLGLSVAKSIIESHHGTIKYIPEAKNTTFKISLPKLQET